MNDNRNGPSRLSLFVYFYVAFSMVSLPLLIMLGKWVPFTIVVTGLLIGMFNPLVRQEISMMTSYFKKEQK